jgi:hypothetical protein
MNDHDSNIASARSWLRYAEEDLDAASELGAGASAPRNVCWLSQQASEKALKAAFVLEGVDFPHIHDLDRLRNSLPEGWSIKKTHPGLVDRMCHRARVPGGLTRNDRRRRALSLSVATAYAT